MPDPNPDLRPQPLRHLEPADLTGELNQLYALAQAGFTLAPLIVVPAAVEELFYRSNALPAQLSELFTGVDQDDPDEDDIEELFPEALRLLKRHFLLDEVIDLFYEALEPLPPKVQVRRPGEVGRAATKGRPALIALKETWADAWRFDALMERMGTTGSIAVEARPVIVGVAEAVEANADLQAQVRVALGQDARVWQHETMGITRLS